jgi:hypothetical protein
MKKLITFCLGIIAFVFVHAQSDSTLKDYVGKYSFPSGSVVSEVSVSLDSTNGVLTMYASAGNSVLEKTTDKDTYSIIAFQGTAVFKRNDNKKVIGIVIDAMSYHLEGTKSESYVAAILQRAFLIKDIAGKPFLIEII